MLKSFFLVATASTLTFGVQAQSNLGYHPNGVMRLGYGYEPSTPNVPFVSSCISYEGVEAIDAGDGALGSVSITEVSDRKSLLESVGVSASMEAHSVMFSGGSSFSKDVSVSFEQTSLVWVARVKLSLGRYRLRNPSATQLLTAMPTPGAAKSRCGPEIVTQETRGAVAAVVYEVNNLTQEEKQTMSAALNAKYEGAGSGAKFDASYRRAAEKLTSRKRISTFVHVQGGPGRDALAQAVDALDLSAVRRVLSDYVKATNTANAAPLAYATSPLSQFVNLEFNAPPNLAQDRLWEIFAQYESLTALIRRIDVLIKPTGEADAYLAGLVSPAQRSTLGTVRAEYEQARSLLHSAAVGCLSGKGSCTVPKEIGLLTRVAWPAIPDAPSIVGVQACSGLARASVIGAPPAPTGTVVGSKNYILGIVGDIKLFHSAWLVASDSRVPLPVTFRRSPPPAVPQKAAAVNGPGAGPIRTAVQQALEAVMVELEAKAVGLDVPDPITALRERNVFTVAIHPNDCVLRDVDKQRLIGALMITLDVRKDIPLGSVEVRDVFGRISSYDLGQL